MPPSEKRFIGLIRNLGLSLAALVLFFFLFEIIAMWMGVVPIAVASDPFVGFSTGSPLFINGIDPVSGQRMLKTAPNKKINFNEQVFLKEKPPNTYRIFCLGGSTTYGRPYNDATSFCGWLREFLNAAGGGVRWEVINAGGISYASYRIAKLMEELVEYQPDLFLIYSGHNEFLEERTYRELKALHPLLRETSALLSRTHAYSALARLIGKQGAEEAEKQKFRMPGEVNTILENSIGPSSYHRDDSLRVRVVAHYKVSLERIIGLARSSGAEVMLINTPSNLADCMPFKSEMDFSNGPEKKRWLDSLLAEGGQLSSHQKYSEALVTLEKGLVAEPRYSLLHYLAGRTYFALGQWEKAKKHFVRSLEEDVCPLRAIGSIQKIQKDIAREQNISFLNFVEVLEKHSLDSLGHSILGGAYFLDHVHLTPEAHRLLALGILSRFGGIKNMPLKIELSDGAVKEATLQVMERLDEKSHGIALHNLAKVLNWAGKHEEAVSLARKGLTKNDSHLEAAGSHLLVATHFHRKGILDSAIDHYRATLRLDSNNSQAHRFLGLALKDSKHYEEARDHIRFSLLVDSTDFEMVYHLAEVEYHLRNYREAELLMRSFIPNNRGSAEGFFLLGRIFRKLGSPQHARTAFERTLKLNPTHAGAQEELETLKDEKTGNGSPVNNLARSLMKNPEDKEALRKLNEALKKAQEAPGNQQ